MQDVRNAIAVGNRNFSAAVEKADATAIAALYTANAKLLPPNSDIVEGTDAIRKFWQAVLDRGVRGAQLDTVELRVCGDTAVELGRYRMKAASGEMVDQGKYIVLWKNVNGLWRLDRDMWNSSVPTSKAQPA